MEQSRMWPFLLLMFLQFASVPEATQNRARHSSIGVDYGQLGNNLPSPVQAVKLIRRMRIGKVKLYDANPRILTALSNTSIKVTVMVPNQQIPTIGASKAAAYDWVKHNVTPFLGSTRIRTVLVGNEILSDFTTRQTIWPMLVPAMKNIHTALRRLGLQRRIKVSTTHAINVLDVRQSYIFPPSNGTFRPDISHSIMLPMLEFLSTTNSDFFIDAYPFFTWQYNRLNISLEFALFDGCYTDPHNGLLYNSLLTVQLDAVVAAMSRLGYDDINLVLSETGWPTKGGVDERGANFYNAALYNRRLVRRVLAKPPFGTPRRPHRPLPTFIFALFNENLKPGPVTERNWGLLTVTSSNGTVRPSYQIDLTGQLGEDEYQPIAKPPPDPSPGTVRLWCIANESYTDITAILGGVNYACGAAGVDCESIKIGRPCFLPNTTYSHASFVFNSYYLNQRVNGASCDFSGAAYLTTRDPSYGSCKYPATVI